MLGEEWILVGLLYYLWVTRILGRRAALQTCQPNFRLPLDPRKPLMDTTELKGWEAEQISEGDLLPLLRSSPDAIYFKDLDSRFLHVSLAMAALVNCHRAEELIGKTDQDFYAAEHALEALADEQNIIRTGEPIIGRVEKEPHQTAA